MISISPRILAHTSERTQSVILLRCEPLTPQVRGEALVAVIAECSAELEASLALIEANQASSWHANKSFCMATYLACV